MAALKFNHKTHQYKPVTKINDDQSVATINSIFTCHGVDIIESEQEFINHISLWLERFSAPKTKFKSLLQVKEHKDAFKLELLFKDTTASNSIPTSLTNMLRQKDAVNEVLYYSNLITEYIPSLSEIFTRDTAIIYSQDEFIKLFFDILPIIKLIGVEALLPKSLKNLILPNLSIAIARDKKNKSTVSYLNLDEILSFDWQVSLGNTNISVAEFKELLKTGNKLVKLKDQYIYLDEKLINNILVSLDKPVNKSTGAALLRDLFMEDSNNIPFVLSKEVKKLIEELLTNKEIAQPSNLLAKLRDYQYQGYCWLYKNVRLGFGSVIADDMGLGKTLQVITCLLKLKQEQLIKRALIIVPTSLLTNWQKELIRFAPELSINMYHGASRADLNNHDITIITYGTVRRDIELVNKHKWDILVIDEAQNIKNLSAQQTKLIKSIKSKYRIAMSGTPVENRLLEYYSIMDFANKGYLGSASHFNKQFAIPIEANRDVDQLNKFLAATKPFVLRRLKSDKSIIQDLPDKIVIDEYCNLTKKQTVLYQATLNNIMNKLKKESDDNVRRGLVLTLILALKQICNHPSQYLKQLDDVDIEASGKLLLLLDKIKDIHANNEKVLIFTQFAEMGTILQNVIEHECNTPVLFLHGGVSRKKRDEMVESIQHNPQHQTMVLSIKAGGVGLNLTSANHVIHYDLWWNPAVENQATDRAYRIGQNKNVFVHRLVCSNSFEEKINQMIKNKQELANLTVATGEQWIGNLSNKELQQIFTLT
jgi:SNF2 family DNA or RNA helicase